MSKFRTMEVWPSNIGVLKKVWWKSFLVSSFSWYSQKELIPIFNVFFEDCSSGTVPVGQPNVIYSVMNDFIIKISKDNKILAILALSVLWALVVSKLKSRYRASTCFILTICHLKGYYETSLSLYNIFSQFFWTALLQITV